jgi:methionine aminotransferase
MQIDSKLPNVGITIFTKMSKMANEHGAINLSQGFPDFPVDPALMDLVEHYMRQGLNQYAPMPGVPELRKAIAEKTSICYDWKPDIDEHITVTCGAIEAIMSTISALINPGDEVVILDPAYDAYEPIIQLQGARAVGVPLNPKDYSIDWKSVWDAISSRTKMLIINSPHNPSGAILTAADLEALEDIVDETGLWVLSDEVYEHIVFDGAIHQSVLRSEGLRKNAVVVSSFGKTFHATGWRMGYMIAPTQLTKEIRKVHQYNTFTIHTPTQYAIADYLKNSSHYQNVSSMYQEKRDFFLEVMSNTKFKPIHSSGTYFQLMRYDEISDMHDVDFAEWLTKEIGVAAIPTSVFYQDRQDNKVLRLCFAKGEETLNAAAQKLMNI